MNFFVTGLPRSRTAWCANFLTYDGRHCWHDLLGEYESVETMSKDLDEGDGIADPFLLLNWHVVAREFPDARWVVIHRDFDDALDSAIAGLTEFSNHDYGRQRYFMTNLMLAKDELVSSNLEVLELQYDAFDAMALWEWCRPDSPLDHQRMSMLMNMRVISKMDNELVKAENVALLLEEAQRARAH